MNKTELQEILEAHRKWLEDTSTGTRADLTNANLHDADLAGANLHAANLTGAELTYADLRRADLTNADLSGADLTYADLRDADLPNADLRCADLTGANLRDANLTGADLHDADLAGANLHDANLSGADLRGANLRCADLRYADLRGADLRGANLTNADLRYADLRRADLSGADLTYACLRGADLADVKTDENTKGFHPVCPAEGEFIGWKKAAGLIVKLKVPAGAKRSSATTNKCRCSKAEVLAIEELDGAPSRWTKKVPSDWNHNFVYEVGKTVEVENFDENRWNECSTGIHFFMTRGEAVAW